MKDHQSADSLVQIWLQLAIGFLAIAATTLLLAVAMRPVIATDRVSHDFLCYWAAGKLVVSGQSPYDAQSQKRVQEQFGWDKQRDGRGVYDFLPFYYPPSVLPVVCVLFVPLDYPTAKLAWLFLNVELLLLSGFLLRRVLPALPASIPVILVPLFAFSFIAALVGQLAPLTLFLVTVLWRLLDARWDRTAGWLLAWMMFKPQLTVVLLPAVIIWSARQDRWHVISGFFVGLGALLGLTTLFVPTWPADLLGVFHVPVPTVDSPWKGATWYLVLRSLGMQGWPLAVVHATVALLWLVLVARTAWSRHAPVEEVIAASLLSAFFVATYGRSYDFPVLLIPLFLLLQQWRGRTLGAALVVIFLVVPFVHWWCIAAVGPHHVSFFWVPGLAAIAWLAACYDKSLRAIDPHCTASRLAA